MDLQIVLAGFGAKGLPGVVWYWALGSLGQVMDLLVCILKMCSPGKVSTTDEDQSSEGHPFQC